MASMLLVARSCRAVTGVFRNAGFRRDMTRVFRAAGFSAGGWCVPGMLTRGLFLGGRFALPLDRGLFGRLGAMLGMVLLRGTLLMLAIVVLRRLFLGPANAKRKDHHGGKHERREPGNARTKSSMG